VGITDSHVRIPMLKEERKEGREGETEKVGKGKERGGEGMRGVGRGEKEKGREGERRGGEGREREGEGTLLCQRETCKLSGIFKN
jgi:hypothetical protein